MPLARAGGQAAILAEPPDVQRTRVPSAEQPPDPGMGDGGFPLARLVLTSVGDAVDVNDLWCSDTGRDARTSLGPGWAEAIDPDHRDGAFELLTRAAVRGSSGTADWLVTGPLGPRWTRWWWRPVEGDRLEVCVADVDDDKRRERNLEARATCDALTGLVNRGEFLDLVDRALHQHRSPGLLTVVFFVDLDGFKVVNDTHGHRVGDEVLRLVAGQLRRAARPDDVVARVGGDEFAVLCEAVPDLGAAERLAQRMRAVIRRPLFAGGRRWQLHASIGFAIGKHGRDTAADVIGRADDAMYATRAPHPRRAPVPSTAPSAFGGDGGGDGVSVAASLVPRLMQIGLSLGSAASVLEGPARERIWYATDELDQIVRDLRHEVTGDDALLEHRNGD